MWSVEKGSQHSSTRLQPRRKRAKSKIAIYGLDVSSPRHWFLSSQNLVNVRFRMSKSFKTICAVVDCRPQLWPIHIRPRSHSYARAHFSWTYPVRGRASICDAEALRRSAIASVLAHLPIARLSVAPSSHCLFSYLHLLIDGDQHPPCIISVNRWSK